MFVASGFGGCLNALRIKNRPYPYTNIQDMENIRLDGCPKEILSDWPCQIFYKEVIYEGSGNMTFDEGLLPFTGENLDLNSMQPMQLSLSVKVKELGAVIWQRCIY